VFAAAFAEIQANQMTRFRLGGLWWMYYNPSFSPALDILNSFVQPFADRALSPYAPNKKSGNFTEELAEFTQDPKQLRDQLVSILLARRDTTASLLSSLFYELAYQPALYARLRQEVMQTLKADGELSYANVKGMKYLQNCLNETPRLYPSVPLNGRYALADTTLPHGGGRDGREVHLIVSRQSNRKPISISTGSVCLYSTFFLHTDEWISWVLPRMSSIPRGERNGRLSLGRIFLSRCPRICLGQNFALTEAAYVVSRMCEKFERIEERSEKPRGSHGFCEDIILSPLEGVKVGLIRA
jgi:hypothetical protein